MTNNPVIGIDFGLNHTIVAGFVDGLVEVIPNDVGNRRTPSVVTFTETEIFVGEAAEHQAARNPRNTIYNIRQLLGHTINDPDIQNDLKNWPFKVLDDNGVVKIEVFYKNKVQKFLPCEIAGMILEKMKNIAENYFQTKVTDAVITVPAYFNDAQSKAIEEAAVFAGLNVIRLINQPIAAAIAVGLKCKSDKARTVLVYDFGAVSFDISIIKISSQHYNIIAIGGHTNLGGEDINKRMLKHFVKKFADDGNDIKNDHKLLQKLWWHCDKMKEKLSTANEIDFNIHGSQLTASLTRARFEDINNDLFDKTIEIVEIALNEAKLDEKEIDDILLVGGCSRIPRVQELLQEFFDGKALIKNINPIECFAQGAAIEAAFLTNKIVPKENIETVKNVQECIEAKYDFEKTVLKIKRDAKKLAHTGNLSDNDRDEVIERCSKLIKWMDINRLATKDEFEKKKSEMEIFWEQIK